jgi:ubiquinol-cytochrome c reductase cytochrome b subunit
MSTTAGPKTPVGKTANFADERVGISKFAKNNLGKVFPDHWSFMLGEIALYSFIIVLISGVYLTLFFKPSLVEVVYDGSYVPLKGILMSESYASTLEISFDVRGGLLMRQIHHWSALFFIGAMSLHMLRVFFTGAFRKPREINWVIGVVLLTLGLLAGFSGYSLPDDLLSGTGLRIAHAIVLGIPLVGTPVAMGLFGGEFPGTDFISRVYAIHILLIPGLILAAVTVHLMLVWYQKHTQYPGPGRTENNVVGYRLFPVYTAKAGGFFFIVFGVTVLIAGLVTINPVWLYGPYMPDQVTAGSQPDWYIGFLDGAVRLMPAWEWVIPGGFTLSLNILIPTLIVPGLMFTLLGLYPWIEQWVTGDKREHHLLDRPRNAPARTGIGVAGVYFYLLLLISGGNDLIATTFDLSINAITWTLRILAIIGPPIVFNITKRICLSLQARDREKMLHGHETGRVLRLPHGEFIEIHQPLSLEEKARILGKIDYRPLQIETGLDDNGVPAPRRGLRRIQARISHWYFKDNVPIPTREELLAAEAHFDHVNEIEAVATDHHRSMEAVGGVLLAPNEDGSSRH